MITTTPRWHINVVKTIMTLIENLHHTLTILWYQEDESILNNKKIIIAAVCHYIFWWGMNMMYKMQLIFFGPLILGISTAFSLPDLIIILLFQVTSFKESFFYWSTNQLSVTHQLSGPTICFWHWKARFVLLLCCRRNSTATGQWPEEDVLSCPAFVSSLSEGQKANT